MIWSKRALRVLALPVFLVLISACSLTDPDDGGTGAQDDATSRTIEHAFGKTTVKGTPERIVSVGFREHDALLALGIQPVMVHQWYSDYTSGVGPWAEPRLDGEAPAIIPSSATDLPFEEIAAEEPDLIVGLDAGLDRQTYDRLEEIAPTIANPKGAAPYAVPYDQEMQMIGEATDQAEEADQWVKDTEDAFTKARDDHPEFEGKTAAVGCPLENGGFALYPTTDPRGEFLTELGFTVPEEVNEVASDDYYAEISAENLSMIEDYDLLLVIDDCGAPTVDLNEHPTFKSLDIAKRGDYIYPAPASDALSHNTVLSVPYALDKLLPKIKGTIS